MSTVRSNSSDSGVTIKDCPQNMKENIPETLRTDALSTDNGSPRMNRTSPPPAYESTAGTASPTNSISSQNISIVTLDENADDSSLADSDSDVEDVHIGPDFTVENILAQKSGGTTNGIILVSNQCEPAISHPGPLSSSEVKPNIGSIAVQNSSDITFGNKTFYQGPVTIKQFLYENNKWRPSAGAEGNDNPGFVNTSNVNLNGNDGPISKKDEFLQKFNLDKRPVLLTVIFTGVALLITAIIMVAAYRNVSESTYRNTIGDGDDSRLNIPINSTIGNDIVSNNPGNLRIVARGEWLAQPPNSNLTDLELPAKRVIIAHTATEGCSAQAECVFRVRYIQTFHMESRGWDDIGYNFLVGGDGAVYIGRGWNKQGAHTKGYNAKSICIAFIGTFNKIVPPDRQLQAAQRLIKEGVKIKKLDENYRLLGHRQLIGTESPGATLFEIIKTWPNWSNNTEV